MSSSGKTRRSAIRSVMMTIGIWCISVLNVCHCMGEQDLANSGTYPRANANPQGESTGQPPDVAQTLEAEQKQLAEKYKLLEEKLFSLHEYEKDGNPTRSKLLERAFLQSQSNMTSTQLDLVVKLLTESKLKDAEKEQKLVLAELNDLLDLLQSEDRGKRVQDEIQRHQEYLKEVVRILRIQKGIRGQTEGGVDAKRLANSESKTADRTNHLAEEIRRNEESDREYRDTPVSEKLGDPNNNPPAGDPTDGDNSKALPRADDSERPNDRDPNQPNDQTENGSKAEDTQQPTPSKAGDIQGNAQGNPGEQSRDSGAPGKPADGQSPGSNQQPAENPIRSRIQAAEQRMRESHQKLESALREDAIEAMKQAEREMALAKKELEEILRQLREEEIERTLAMLEGRFRQMLEREIRVHESTQKLDRIASEQRGTEFEIKAGKLASEQNSIATEAARALLLLHEDGSSVAFPATVDEMHLDMLQVASRLSAARVGQVSIELEEDIIDTLEYLIEALVQTQQDLEKMKQSQQGKPGQPGDKPLVDQLAEIKMLRGLQERIFRRHSRYSRFLDDPDDPVGGTDDPDLQAALQRLAEKQARLTEIARDIVNEKNK